MADAFYEEYRNGMLGGGVHAQPDVDTNDIRVGLRDEGTTALNLATQIDVADVRSALVGSDTALASQTVGSAGVGAFDHADETYPALSGATVESLDYFDFQTASFLCIHYLACTILESRENLKCSKHDVTHGIGQTSFSESEN